MVKYQAKSNGDANAELYGITDEVGQWVVKPCLPDFISACALEERMNICAQLAAGKLKVTVPLLARLGMPPEIFENFHVYA